jgi:hypothetical protein
MKEGSDEARAIAWAQARYDAVLRKLEDAGMLYTYMGFIISNVRRLVLLLDVVLTRVITFMFFVFFWVYYEATKRELNTKLVNECRVMKD